jgi:hypothetical protein
VDKRIAVHGTNLPKAVDVNAFRNDRSTQWTETASSRSRSLVRRCALSKIIPIIRSKAHSALLDSVKQDRPAVLPEEGMLLDESLSFRLL